MYKLYMSDVPMSILSEWAIYAEHIYIYDKTKNTNFAHLSMQNHRKEIRRWAISWRIQINSDKTTAVVVSKKIRLKLFKLSLHDVYRLCLKMCHIGTKVKLEEAL